MAIKRDLVAEFRSVMTAEEKTALLSPGESTLLRMLRKAPAKSFTLREIGKHPDFHGWDPDTLQIVINRLMGMGVVDWDGKALRLKHASTTGEEVVQRFLQEA